ncbi:DUF5309 family protein [Paenibacillus sp. SI8]|uniref:SU10 major capsid protein n=1 Tax=unclassified Paenibacillus TaxID=185978 RepID=UPI0034668B64
MAKAPIYDASLIGKKQSVVDEILLLNPHQTPLLNLIGFAEPVTQTTHQWFEDEIYADESKVNGSVLVGGTAIVVVDVEPFRVGHVVKVADELIYVSAINTGTKTLTVTRGYASTTAAAIADQAKIEVQFVEGAEGADARTARYKARTSKSNYTQIFDDSVQISGSAEAITQYGISDLYEYEKQKKQIELALSLEKAVINGVAYQNGQVRQMSGIRSFIQTNVADAQGAAIDGTKLNDSLQSIYEKGGFASGGNFKIMVPAKQKRAISALDANKILISQSENSRGQVVDHFVSDFGQFEIILNNNLDAKEALIVDVNRVAIRPLASRDFFHMYMGQQGDYKTGMLVGEYTLELNQEKAHARIKGLA